jgi:penicillin amidase
MDSAHVDMQDPSPYTTIQLIKNQPNFSFFDQVATPEKESAIDLLRKSFSAGVISMEAWMKKNGKAPQWSAYHERMLMHITQLPALSHRIQHGGGPGSINGHGRRGGSNWRMVVSLEKSGVKAWGVYPGGQSGNPGSPYYNQMTELWSQGKYLAFHFTSNPEQLESKMLFTTQFSPFK